MCEFAGFYLADEEATAGIPLPHEGTPDGNALSSAMTLSNSSQLFEDEAEEKEARKMLPPPGPSPEQRWEQSSMLPSPLPMLSAYRDSRLQTRAHQHQQHSSEHHATADAYLRRHRRSGEIGGCIDASAAPVSEQVRRTKPNTSFAFAPPNLTRTRIAHTPHTCRRSSCFSGGISTRQMLWRRWTRRCRPH